MSKKKNTLKDLDEFLKQQAAILVTPTQLAEKISESKPPVESTVSEISTPAESPDKVLFDLQNIAADRKRLYDLIVKSIESQKESLPEDKMLINTALYLKSGDNWKEVIRNYWKSR